MRLKKKMLSPLIVLSAILSLICSSLSPLGAERVHAFDASDADTAIKAFNDMFWDPAANTFWANSNRNSHQGFWVEAELWEMVMDAYVRTSDPDLKAELRTQIDDIFDGAVAIHGEDWTNNPFNDDIMWWAMGSARAYQLTGEQRYLDKAKYYFDFVYDTQWDDEFAGGGIWWLNSEHTTKNSCINFPAAQAAVYMYNITQDEHYLDAAVRIFSWGKTRLSNGNGLIYDRIEVASGVQGGATHYNQGTYIGAAVGLYQATGIAAYLDDAVKAASHTMNHMVDANGLLYYEGPNGDLKGGKTILMRNLGFLQKALNAEAGGTHEAFEEEFDYWLAFNAEMAWSHRNAANIVDGNWAGQLLAGTYESWSSSGAVEALTVVEPMDVELQYAVKNAHSRIEAEAYNIGTGFVMEGSADGTSQLGGIQPGHYAAYKNVNFGDGGAMGFIARASSGTGGGQIEIRLDSLQGDKVGTLNVEGTGGWNYFMDAVAPLQDEQGNPIAVTGTHDVYLVFKKTNDDYLFNLNWFRFTASDPTDTHPYSKLQAERYDGSEGLGKNEEGGYLDAIHNGAYASYSDLDFGSGAGGITLRAASGNQGGTIEVRLDGPDGPTAGVIEIPALGNWNEWVDVMAPIDHSAATGVRDLYLVFRGKDGSDFPCNLDWFAFTSARGKDRDAYGKLEAEDATNGAGFGRESGGGQTYLAGLYGPNNPYAMYNYVDFGSASPSEFHVQAASATGGGTIEVRIGSMKGPIIATAAVSGTGGWQNFQLFSADVTVPVTGKQIVFLLFKGGDWLYNLDKFTFGDPAVFTAPPPTTEPEDDNDPPGEVDHVRVIRGDDALKLSWDGPYDRDAAKTQITLLREGQPVGSVAEVNRGVQTAVISGIEQGVSYSLFIRNVDESGNASQGILVGEEDLPTYTLTAAGKRLRDGDSFEDDAYLAFDVGASSSGIASATIAIDGKTYGLDPAAGDHLQIDMAGKLGEKSATVAIEDRAGNKLTETIRFEVTTSVGAMERLLKRYKASGDVKGPLVNQLANALKQAGHHLGKGKPKEAAKHMGSFVKHLNNKTMSRHVTDVGKAALNTDAQTLIRLWNA
ncbi:carbohydrate-binding protein [Paenibacillus arenilitoris]|uniref:Carbohydrate-binding protein n=1 Tax=Paenibacillus arenilitoris TaxID=2772299 RepID=A0A927CSI4_9BACL|nr:carbohydrate-binding protein [Paenibacillus arenilitoris]MBD2870805.1 carbohydrate-binding protein [Paenibacillus arenilitoris]